VGSLGWDVKCETCSPGTLALLWSRLCCGSGGWEGREKENDGGYCARLITFYFHGSPHKIVIFLKWERNLKNFCGTGICFLPSSLSGFLQKFFLLLIFFFNESSP